MDTPTRIRSLGRRVSALLGMLAGASAAVTVFVLLYHQLSGDAMADWVGHLLVVSVLTWWFLTRRPSAADADLQVTQRVARPLRIIGWAGTGLLLTGGLAYYVAIHPWQPRFDGWLALFGAALVGTGLMRGYGRRAAGDPAGPPAVRGWRRAAPLLRRAVYIGLAGAAPALGSLAAVAAFWVPVTATTLLRDWAPGWLALPMAVLVWLPWVVAFGWATGMYQTMIIHRYGSIHGLHYQTLQGWRTREDASWSDSVDHTVLPFRTGLSPLFQVVQNRSLRNEVTSSHQFGSSYTGLTYEQLWTRFVEFPPAYLPLWLRWAVARWRPNRFPDREHPDSSTGLTSS